MTHNLSLPEHKYVVVRGLEVTGEDEWIPAVWFGISSTPGRALGCHVLLESGAMLSDLPLHWLGTHGHEDFIEDVQAWDCFGWEPIVTQFAYLNLLEAEVLDTLHQQTDIGACECWFTLDWKDGGWSNHPGQHKLLHLLACPDGSLRLLPTDRVLWHDKSFTENDGVPAILRQTRKWSVE